MEEGLIGLGRLGRFETLTILPEKAYGEPSDENIQEFETEEPERCSDARRLKRVYLDARSQGEVIHVDEEVVRVDFNPRLAGETLTFDVEIIDVNWEIEPREPVEILQA